MTPLKKVYREKGTGICGRAGADPTPTYTGPHSSSVVFSVHSISTHRFHEGRRGDVRVFLGYLWVTAIQVLRLYNNKWSRYLRIRWTAIFVVLFLDLLKISQMRGRPIAARFIS